MYEVEHFLECDVSVMRAYIDDNPFAALVVNTADGPSVDHLPLEFDPVPGPEGRVVGHIA